MGKRVHRDLFSMLAAMARAAEQGVGFVEAKPLTPEQQKHSEALAIYWKEAKRSVEILLYQKMQEYYRLKKRFDDEVDPGTTGHVCVHRVEVDGKPLEVYHIVEEDTIPLYAFPALERDFSEDMINRGMLNMLRQLGESFAQHNDELNVRIVEKIQQLMPDHPEGAYTHDGRVLHPFFEDH